MRVVIQFRWFPGGEEGNMRSEHRVKNCTIRDWIKEARKFGVKIRKRISKAGSAGTASVHRQLLAVFFW